MTLFGRVGCYARRFSKNKVVLSMTATHGRSDGDFPIGEEEPDARVTTYSLVKKKRCPPIYGITTYMEVGDAEIDHGKKSYSVKPGSKAGDKYWKSIVAAMVEVHKKMAKIHKRVIPTCAFVHRIEEAELVAKMFNKKSGLGEKGLAVLTGKTSEKERNKIDYKIRSGELLGYVTCGVGVESIDIPELSVCHLICRTQSVIRLVQSIGRVIRATGSKKFALVVDYHIKKPCIINACLGLAEYAINVGVPRKKAEETKQVGIVAGSPDQEIGNLTFSLGDIEAWICRSMASEKKKALLAMPKGSKRPTVRESKLGSALSRYTNPKKEEYDPEFDSAIRKRHPQWFLKIADENKETLLDMPEGSERPYYKTKLGKALVRYTSPNNKCYDAKFDDEIRKRQPQWFVDTMAENKRALLSMAKGVKRPHHSTKIAVALSGYTSPKSKLYDEEFDAKIRKKQPQWFLNSADENKKNLLAMHKQAEKPRSKTKMGRALSAYTNPNNKLYDEEFDAKIRKKQPQWFK
jgi:hypothetical protein